MMDLEHARQIASRLRGAGSKQPVIVVDNTMLGPIYQRPLAHGTARGLFSVEEQHSHRSLAEYVRDELLDFAPVREALSIPRSWRELYELHSHRRERPLLPRRCPPKSAAELRFSPML
jgi:hypothetical protein